MEFASHRKRESTRPLSGPAGGFSSEVAESYLRELPFFQKTPLPRIRRLQEISQEELAARAGLHRTYVGEVERGERNPSIDVMERLAQGLSVSLSELLSESCGT